ncbi:myosin-4 [Ditylenchus destructor]|nr:myosin-4 [Ditylenchus destructor]
MDNSETGKESSPPENDIKSAERNVDESMSDEYEVVASGKEDEYEDKSLNLDFDCFDEMSINESSIFPTASNGEIGTNEVNISEKTRNVPSQAALLEIETKLRQEFNQQMLALRQELMFKNKAKDLSDNVGRSVQSCNVTRETQEDGNVSSKKTAHDLYVIINKQETEKQTEGHQIESLQDEITAQNGSNAELNEENEHPDSAEEMNRSSVEGLHVKRDKQSHLSKAKDELKPPTDQRTKTALFALIVLLLLGLTFFGLAWFGKCLELKSAQGTLLDLFHYKASTQREIEALRNSRYAEIKQRRKTEGELKLAQEELGHYKASTQREIEDLQNSLDVEMKQHYKTESDLKLAQRTLDELRRDKAEAENALTSPANIRFEVIMLFVHYYAYSDHRSVIYCSEKHDDYEVLRALRDKFNAIEGEDGQYQFAISGKPAATRIEIEAILLNFGFDEKFYDANHSKGNGYQQDIGSLSETLANDSFLAIVILLLIFVMNKSQV